MGFLPVKKENKIIYCNLFACGNQIRAKQISLLNISVFHSSARDDVSDNKPFTTELFSITGQT